MATTTDILKATPNQYPIAELMTITVTKPQSEFTAWEHLLLGELVERIRRVKREGGFISS